MSRKERSCHPTTNKSSKPEYNCLLWTSGLEGNGWVFNQEGSCTVATVFIAVHLKCWWFPWLWEVTWIVDMEGHPNMCKSSCLGSIVRLMPLERSERISQLAFQLFLSAAFQQGWAVDPVVFVLRTLPRFSSWERKFPSLCNSPPSRFPLLERI